MSLSFKEELMLLAILNRNNSSYGTEIIEDVSQASGGKVQLDYGFLFPTLRKLCGRERRLIRRLQSNHVSIRTGGHRRVYYEVTELGKQALLEADNTRRNLGGKVWLRLVIQVLKKRLIP
ncbi:MAG: PadR family transcriptional regulator [Calothrix sp. FI2-JRJ7]|jgi:DNA-binding PadR family transcriptional regulator|nr:PadR family transcriptional regulator [Calothrix sp. FI2-JRJ7]